MLLVCSFLFCNFSVFLSDAIRRDMRSMNETFSSAFFKFTSYGNLLAQSGLIGAAGDESEPHAETGGAGGQPQEFLDGAASGTHGAEPQRRLVQGADKVDKNNPSV